MMISWLTIFTYSTLLSSLIIADDPCRYQHPTKGVIDLTSLGRTDGKPAYPDKIPPTGSGYKFSYNPCKPFTEQPNCIGVAVCQVSMDGKLSFTLGTQDTTKWDPGAVLGSSPSVSYSAGEKKVIVILQCATDDTNELEALGEPTINNYRFILTHKCACWDGCGSGPPETTTKSGGGGGSGGLPGGAVFIIILVVLLFAYFVGFAAYYRFRLEKGGVDLIAHRTFWVGLPGYAKDGVVHVYRRVANKGDTPYQSV